MIYKYICTNCNMEINIEKSMADSDRIEHCEICENELNRVYIAPSVATGDGFKK